MMRVVMDPWTPKKIEFHFPRVSIGIAVTAKAQIIQAAK
jgi:hypothetical protein